MRHSASMSEKSHAVFLSFNSLRPRHDGRHFADDTFNRIFVNENVRISIKISLKFVPRFRINNIPPLAQIMAWRRLGDKPLSEPMMVSLLTQICVTRPQLVNVILFPFILAGFHILGIAAAIYTPTDKWNYDYEIITILIVLFLSRAYIMG